MVPAGQETSICWSPNLAVGVPTWFGLVSGRTWLDAAEAGESPISLVATTVKVYQTLFVSPLTVVAVTCPTVVEPEEPLSLVQLTVKPVIGEPLAAPACQASSTVFDTVLVATTFNGAPGLSRTVKATVPDTSRAGSLVASASRKPTLIWPLKPSAGVIVNEVPAADTVPWPSVTLGCPTKVNGLPSAANGLVT